MKQFIYLFETPKNYYFYDVNRNENVQVGKDVYEYLSSIITNNNALNPNKSIHEDIKHLKELGYLSENRIEIIEHPLSNDLELYLERQLGMLILQVTQCCNLRCSYCPYSANDGSNRLHSNKKMSWELAKDSIDYYKERTIDSQKAVICFYGGEPLLEFELIKKCVSYSNKIFEGKDLSFYITTNGTLIDQDKAKFLNDNSFRVTISLDGTKETNDKNRKFANNDASVFDIVISNIIMINKYYKNLFFRTHINMVMDQRQSFQQYLNIFDEFKFLRNIQIRMTTIDDTSLSNRIEASPEFIQQYSYYKFLTYLHLLGKVDIKDEVYYLEHFLDQCIDMMNGFNTQRVLGKRGVPSGSCLVGKDRLMVNTDGNMYPCERVSETIEKNCIGNIEDGFNLLKAKNLLNISKTNKLNCKECYAFRHCTLCPKSYEYLSGDSETILNRCNQCRIEFHHKLIGIEILNEIRYGK